MSAISEQQPTAGAEKIEAGPKAPLWASLTGTFFYAGKMKPGPGTWGSVGALVVWWAIGSVIPATFRLPAVTVLTLVVVAIGIPAATRVAREAGREDPSWVVIDEVAGQLIAVIGAPLTWKALLAGLILFRIFDIFKPFPLRRLEHLPEGTGIMMDDVGAGIYALIIMRVLLHYGILR